MIKNILGAAVALFPLVYGLLQYYKVNKITKNSTEDELVELDQKLSWMKRSGFIFTAVGAYMVWEFLKLHNIDLF